MRITILHPAPTGTRYAEGAFDQVIAKRDPINLLGWTATLEAALFDTTGRWANLTLKVPGHPGFDPGGRLEVPE